LSADSDAVQTNPPSPTTKLSVRAEQVDQADSSSSQLLRWAPALRHTYFRWYLLGHLLSVIGGWMQDAGLRWYVQILTKDVGSERWLGITAAMASLPIVIFSPIGGALADRLPKRLVIAATQSAGMLIALLLALLVWIDALPLALVLVFAALHGTFLAFDIPARQAFAIEMVGRKDLMSAIGLNSTIFNMGRLVGPMSAGLAMLSGGTLASVIVQFGWAPSSGMTETRAGVMACFLLNAFSFVGLVLLLIFMPMPPRDSEEPAPAKSSKRSLELMEGVRAVRDRPQARGLLVCLLMFLLAGGSYPTLIPALADYELNADEGGYSMLLTANGLGSVVGALIVASIHNISSRRIPIVAGLALVAIGLVETASSSDLFFASISLFVTGIGFILFLASANSTIQLGVPDEVRGRVMSIWVAVFGIGLPLGSLLSGYVAQRIGTASTLWYQGWATWGAVLIAFFVLGRPNGSALDPPVNETSA
jgi:predicted MFS family arabinose efflux permease